MKAKGWQGSIYHQNPALISSLFSGLMLFLLSAFYRAFKLSIALSLNMRLTLASPCYNFLSQGLDVWTLGGNNIPILRKASLQLLAVLFVELDSY